MSQLSYKDLLKHNKELDELLSGKPYYNIQVLSNITINQITEPLEYSLRSAGIRGKAHIGDYNNIIQQSALCKQFNATIVFWEFCNLIENFHYSIHNLTDEELSDLMSKVKSEIDLTIANLQASSLVIWNRFSGVIFNHHSIHTNRIDEVVHELNRYLEEHLPKNFFLINTDKILALTGLPNATDEKFFLHFKSLYTISFLSNYSEFVLPIFRAVNGIVKKVLVLDCDNTLWKGIIGEDGMEGIKMAKNEKSGAPFAEIQSLARYLNSQGVLLGVCSKNNFEEVERVFKEHPDMILKWEDITTKKINWVDKETNLREMAKELNLGLDSFVFIDDSNFEVNLIRENLPEVSVLQVPQNLYQYPRMFREMIPLFFTSSRTVEDKNKAKQYAEEINRKDAEKEFRTFEDYLTSLQLEANLYLNPAKQVARISQMTQKTNQFNFTTKRYSEADIQSYLNSETYLIATFDVKDRFGDYGITGLYILQKQANNDWLIDTMLMSCRVIGRKVEYAVFEGLMNYLRNLGSGKVLLNYIKTPKNTIVENLGEEFGFTTIDKNDTSTGYSLNLKDFKGFGLDYVKVNFQTTSATA